MISTNNFNARSKMPDMLMIGSACSNTGKTLLASSLIEKFNGRYPVEAIKITTIADGEGGCPKGGRGCGVCSGMEGKFSIVEETDPAGGKDTCRLLASGARRVFWLRSFAEHLGEGFLALREKLSEDAVYICESNSLRNFIEPGLFLFVKPVNDDSMKASAHSVHSCVDREIEWDGANFSGDIDGIDIIDGKWALRESATAIILAGGKSTRMGRDKALLPIGGRPMIEGIIEQLRTVFSEVIISAADDSKYSFKGVTVIPDEVADEGPFQGIICAMRRARFPVCLVISCDIPEVPVRLVRRMIALAHNADGAVPVRDGYPEPMFAVYSKKLLPLMERSFAVGNRKLQNIYGDCALEFIPIVEPIENINDEKRYQAYLKRRLSL